MDGEFRLKLKQARRAFYATAVLYGHQQERGFRSQRQTGETSGWTAIRNPRACGGGGGSGVRVTQAVVVLTYSWSDGEEDYQLEAETVCDER